MVLEAKGRDQDQYRDQYHDKKREDGEGMILIDVCCGKGIGALMLAMALPRSRIIGMDSNTDMDLTHFKAAQNLDFRLIDVFAGVFPASVVQLTQGASWAALVGTHLCGALSPRFVSVFRRCRNPNPNPNPNPQACVRIS